MAYKNKKTIETRCMDHVNVHVMLLHKTPRQSILFPMEIIKYKISRYDNNGFSMVIYRAAEISFP